jgi:hypothetical protein
VNIRLKRRSNEAQMTLWLDFNILSSFLAPVFLLGLKTHQKVYYLTHQRHCILARSGWMSRIGRALSDKNEQKWHFERV